MTGDSPHNAACLQATHSQLSLPASSLIDLPMLDTAQVDLLVVCVGVCVVFQVISYVLFLVICVYAYIRVYTYSTWWKV